MATSTRPRAPRKTPVARKPVAPRKAATPSPTAAPAKSAPAKSAPAETAAAPDAKPPKRKLVRDSFTIPRDEYAAIDALKLRAAKLGHIAKKSELLRAGLKLLTAASDAALLRALVAVPSIKTGRPKAKQQQST
jgi:hypothetical protein